ncbi:DUF411 domain-containing protein [Microbulbifer sp. SAOS-129_SWC]|uniref:DUF411 domain-containing protein n=1 Tax=Microbulbifer sp. SAOS-129_SWC TaxID=3145235 RepID=UPI00321680ED
MRKFYKPSVATAVLVLLLAAFPVLADNDVGKQGDNALVVYKNPLCFCCRKWMAHLHKAGIRTRTDNSVHMGEIKGQWGVPAGMQSCHTAVWQQKYVFEGHVPARLIRQYLSDPPEGSFGLTVPGMPKGSPGMDDGGEFEPYNVYLLMRGGDYRFYTRVTERESR